MIARHRLVAFTLVLLGVTGAACAGSADDAATHYPLTMERIHAYVAAMGNLAKAEARDPKLADSLEKLTDADTPTATVIAGYEASPAATQAIKAAGLTPQQFVYIGAAFLGATFGFAYQQQTHGKLDKVYDAANVEFYKAHQKELEAIFGAGSKGTPAQSNSGDDQ